VSKALGPYSEFGRNGQCHITFREDEIMKKFVLLFLVLAVLALGSVNWKTNASASTGKQQALAVFRQPIQVNGVTLKAGEYLFVHDDAAMNRGESCTYVYKGNAPLREKLVVSFHCTPAQRAKATQFIVRTAENVPGTVELREIQFKGDTEAHLVPAMEH